MTVRNDKNLKHLFSGATPAGGQNGMTFASVSNLRVEGSAVSGMTSNDAAACLFLGRTKSVVVRNFDCNGATGPRGNEALGIELNGDKFTFRNLVITDVKNDSTTAAGNRAVGIQINANESSDEISASQIAQ